MVAVCRCSADAARACCARRDCGLACMGSSFLVDSVSTLQAYAEAEAGSDLRDSLAAGLIRVNENPYHTQFSLLYSSLYRQNLLKARLSTLSEQLLVLRSSLYIPGQPCLVIRDPAVHESATADDEPVKTLKTAELLVMAKTAINLYGQAFNQLLRRSYLVQRDYLYWESIRHSSFWTWIHLFQSKSPFFNATRY